MSEHQRAVWTMSSTVSSSYNLAMQELTANNYTTGEQHKELSTSTVSRDEVDLEKVAAKLDSFTPFSDDKSLRNIITGVNANVHTRCICLKQRTQLAKAIRNDATPKSDSAVTQTVPVIDHWVLDGG